MLPLPVSAYSISKRACEFYLKSFNQETKINAIAVRLLMFMDQGKMTECYCKIY